MLHAGFLRPTSQTEDVQCKIFELFLIEYLCIISVFLDNKNH